MPPASPSRDRRRLRRIGIAVFLLGGLSAGVALYQLRAPSPPAAPVHDDPAVYLAYTEARAEVLQKPRAAGTWGKFGMTLLANRDYAVALPVFAEAEKLDATDYRWPYLQAVLLQQARSSAAVAKARQAQQLAPQLVDVHLLVGEFSLAHGDPDQAAAAFEQALRFDPNQPHALLGKARVLAEQQRLHESRAALAQVQTHREVAKAANLLLAEVLHRSGQAQQAQEPYRLARRLSEDPPRTDALTAEVKQYVAGLKGMRQQVEQLIQTGQLDAALALQKQAVANYPTHYEAHFELGKVHALRAGRLTEGAARQRAWADSGASLQAAQRLAPDNMLVKFYLGLLSFEQRDQPQALRQALEHFRVVVRRQPDDTLAAQHLGECLLLVQDWPGAEATYRRLVQNRPDLAHAHAGLAQALEGQGKTIEAMAAWWQAHHLEPSDVRFQTRWMLALRSASGG